MTKYTTEMISVGTRVAIKPDSEEFFVVVVEDIMSQ